MNRVIKFRAWDKEKKDMIYNGLEYQLRFLDTDNDNEADESIGFCQSDHDHFNIMQYTGLKDKNGVEIYEGDVLSSPHFTTVAGMTYTLNHLVEWSDKLHGWFLLSCQSKNPNDGSIQLFVAKNSEMSVIGNLHENPELIK